MERCTYLKSNCYLKNRLQKIVQFANSFQPSLERTLCVPSTRAYARRSKRGQQRTHAASCSPVTATNAVLTSVCSIGPNSLMVSCVVQLKCFEVTSTSRGVTRRGTPPMVRTECFLVVHVTPLVPVIKTSNITLEIHSNIPASCTGHHV